MTIPFSEIRGRPKISFAHNCRSLSCQERRYKNLLQMMKVQSVVSLLLPKNFCTFCTYSSAKLDQQDSGKLNLHPTIDDSSFRHSFHPLLILLWSVTDDDHVIRSFPREPQHLIETHSLAALAAKSLTSGIQCDQIGRFIALWATF